MAERNATRNDGSLWLERIAWNAAALAALAVMLLVLLGTFEWLDRVSRKASDENRGGRAIRAAAEVDRRASG